MSEDKGLEAACYAYDAEVDRRTPAKPHAMEAAIRAYEAHKASALKGDDMGDEEEAPDSVVLAWGRYYKASAIPMVGKYVADYGPIPDLSGPTGAEELLANSRLSAVPEEIAEVVEWCRRKGLGTPPDSMPNRAADLLEGYARLLSSSKP